jgi:hypothetical protein
VLFVVTPVEIDELKFAVETVAVNESTIRNSRVPLPEVGFVVTIALTVIESPAAAPMNVEFTVAEAVSPAAIADFTGVSVRVSAW